jgi:hypothetical protein
MPSFASSCPLSSVAWRCLITCFSCAISSLDRVCSALPTGVGPSTGEGSSGTKQRSSSFHTFDLRGCMRTVTGSRGWAQCRGLAELVEHSRVISFHLAESSCAGFAATAAIPKSPLDLRCPSLLAIQARCARCSLTRLSHGDGDLLPPCCQLSIGVFIDSGFHIV